MELAFATRELRGLCEDPERALAMFPPDVVEALTTRLADMDAAESIHDLVAGRPTTTADPTPRLTLTLAAGLNLICEVNQSVVPTDASGNIDFVRVRRWKVIAIETDR